MNLIRKLKIAYYERKLRAIDNYRKELTNVVSIANGREIDYLHKRAAITARLRDLWWSAGR